MRTHPIRRVLILALGLSSMTALGAEVPNILPYQGRLVDAGGSPITSATVVRLVLLRGGDATSLPSSGVPVYREDVTIQPDADGLFDHLIGTGSPAGFCDENADDIANEACVLDPEDFPSGDTALFLEMRIDPAGADNVLIPRQRIGTVGYAMRAATLNGFTVGTGTGDIPTNDGILNQNLNADLLDGLNASEIIDAQSQLFCAQFKYVFGSVDSVGCGGMPPRTFSCPTGTLLLGATLQDSTGNEFGLNSGCGATVTADSVSTSCVTEDSCNSLTPPLPQCISSTCSADVVTLTCCQ